MFIGEALVFVIALALVIIFGGALVFGLLAIAPLLVGVVAGAFSWSIGHDNIGVLVILSSLMGEWMWVKFEPGRWAGEKCVQFVGMFFGVEP